MRLPSRVFLIGPMGSGKSTIGRQLAALLGLAFADSDHEIQRRTGVDIPTIFEYEGEAGFRAREKAVIDELTSVDGQVLATGGGAILDPDNRRALSSRGVVVYLHCSPEQQHRRTSHDRNRPLLHTGDPLQRLRDLMVVRDPLYRETADLVVSTEKRSAASVAREILRLLQARGGSQQPN
jgi:shikimate kinase